MHKLLAVILGIGIWLGSGYAIAQMEYSGTFTSSGTATDPFGCSFSRNTNADVTISIADSVAQVVGSGTQAVSEISCGGVIQDTSLSIDIGFSSAVDDSGFGLSLGADEIGRCEFGLQNRVIACDFSVTNLVGTNDAGVTLSESFSGSIDATNDFSVDGRYEISTDPASGAFKVDNVGLSAVGSISIRNIMTGSCGLNDIINVSTTLDPDTVLSPWDISTLLNTSTIEVCPGETFTLPVTFISQDDLTYSLQSIFEFADATTKSASLIGATESIWETVISGPLILFNDVNMGERYSFSIDVTNKSGSDQVYNFNLMMGSDLNGDWDLAAVNSVDCDSFSLNTDTAITISANETRSLNCTALHTWNWAPPLDSVGMIADIGAGQGIDRVADIAEHLLFRTLEQLRDFADKAGAAVDVLIGALSFVYDTAKTQGITYTVGLDGKQTALTVNIDVPNDKQSLMVVSTAYSIATSAAAAKAVAAGCLTPASAAVLPCVAALGGTIVAIKSSAELRDAAIDPRTDYDIVTPPAFLSIAEIDALSSSPEKDWAMSAIELEGYVSAFFLAYVRYRGALIEGEMVHAQRQWEAFQLYYTEISERLSYLGANASDVFETSLIDTQLSPSDLSNALANSSRPVVWDQAFEAVQASSDDVAAFESALESMPELYYEPDTVLSLFDAIGPIAAASVDSLPDPIEGSIRSEFSIDRATINLGSPPADITVILELEVGVDLLDVLSADLSVNGQPVSTITDAETGDANNNVVTDLSAVIPYSSIDAHLVVGTNDFALVGEMVGGEFFANSAFVSVTGSRPSGGGNSSSSSGGGGSVDFLVLLLLSGVMSSFCVRALYLNYAGTTDTYR